MAQALSGDSGHGSSSAFLTEQMFEDVIKITPRVGGLSSGDDRLEEYR
jgi:hypothetical protein